MTRLLRYVVARRLYPSTIIEGKKDHVDATVTEKYVLSTLLFAITLWLFFLVSDTFKIVGAQSSHWFVYARVLCVCWLLFRVFETSAFSVDALLFEAYRKGRRTIRDPDRYLVLVLMNFAELVFAYAFIYRSFIGIFEIKAVHPNLSILSLGFSFFTMTSLGSTPMTLMSDWGHVLALTQSAIGLFMALIAVSFALSIPRRTKIGS